MNISTKRLISSGENYGKVVEKRRRQTYKEVSVMVTAYWSGSYPCLCYGEWTLQVNGNDVSHLIPEDLKNGSMNTYGEYQSWHFEDWIEMFESYCDGLACNEWIDENKYWIDVITTDMETQEEIFYAIQKEDFRPGSCGGCI